MSVTELIAPAAKPRPLPPEAPRHLRLVGNEEYAAIQRRRRMRVGGVVLAASVIILLFAAVAMHVVLAQNQFRLDQVDTQAAAQQAKYQQLRLEVDRLEAPSRIMATAEGRLGMVSPATVTFLNPSSATSAPAGATRPTGGPAPATPPAGWSTIKPQLVASP
jgi:cell division protein FtsL